MVFSDCIHSRKLSRLIILVLVLCLAPVAGSARRQGPKYAPDQIIVKFRPGKAAAMQSLNKSVGASVKRDLKRIGYVSLKLPKGSDLDAVLARYRSHPAVEYAGPNHIFHTLLAPNDPYVLEGFDPLGIGFPFTAPQWGIRNDPLENGYDGTAGVDINAFNAWQVFFDRQMPIGDPNVIIAVLDTGIDFLHPDFVKSDYTSKIWTNTDEIPGNGIDDDGNGYIDDVDGWDYIHSNGHPQDDLYSADYMMYIYHGTWVSGIAGAATDNYEGIAGVAWECPIMALKVVDTNDEATEDDVAAAVTYAVDNGAKIINMSFGLESVGNPSSFEAAVNDAWSRGAVLVCAAGNTEGALYSPAVFDNVLSVGAIDSFGYRCRPASTGWGSSYGSFLDVMAPGNAILSCTSMWDHHTYGDLPGTSAASPFVAGVAALVWSLYPDWTNQQVVDQIKRTCIDITSDGAVPGVNLTGWDIYTGWGRVDAFRALTETMTETQTLAELKNMDAGTRVVVRGKFLSTASGSLTNRLYVQEQDRSCGILLSFSGSVPANLQEGNKVDVEGVVGKVQGECTIVNPIVTKVTPEVTIVPKPVAMSGKTLGGGAKDNQGATLNVYSFPTENAIGLNNVGLLVKVSGKVIKPLTSSSFYLDDGSGLEDDQGNIGVFVDCGTAVRPQEGKFVAVTGISSCVALAAPHDNVLRKVLKVRKQSDIVILK